MWNFSQTEDKWTKKVEKLDKRIYNFLRQEIEDVRFYSKCLDGTSYVAIQDMSDIYDVLKYKDNITYKINSTYSDKFSGTDVTGTPISSGNFSDKGTFFRYNNEYGFTLKNLFTPKRLINDSTNYIEVDVATSEPLNFNNIDINESTVIDGITLVENHRVLVKDNVTNVTLDSSVDPDEYFSSNYYILSTIGNSITYFYYNSENGVYKYTGGTLVRESDLDEYLNNIRYSVSVKRGNNNANKQFHLSRLLSGYYPLVSNSEPIEFTEKENFIVRNSLEYRNVLDNQFYKGIIQHEGSYVKSDGKTYYTPERAISVGDFGFIVNYQDGYPNIIKNKYKEDLRDIIELNDKYLSIGKNGTLLNIDKTSLVPELIEIDTFQNFKSIDFADNNRGFIVGENGTIIYTNNQVDWNILESNIKNNLNKVQFRSLSKAVIGGNNGVLSEINIKNRRVDITPIDLTIKENRFDEREIISDILDIDNVTLNSKKFKFTNNDYLDIIKNIGSSNFSIDFRFKPTDLSGGTKTILSFITEKFPTTTGSTLDKGIRIKLVEDGSNYRLKMDINDDSDPTTFITLDGDVLVEQNKWYHVFITRDKGEYQLFVDQKLSDSTQLGFQGSFDNFNNRIRIGSELTYTDGATPSYSSSTFNSYTGVVDQVRTWNKKLDISEIEEFSNIYQIGLSGLQSWYKLNVYYPSSNERIRTTDMISSNELILPITSNLTVFNTSGGSTMIDNEEFRGIVCSGDSLISIIIDIPENYSNQVLNNKFFIRTSTTDIKNVLLNTSDNYFYGVGSNVFRISSLFEFDLFNKINLLNLNEEILLDNSFQDIKLDTVTQKLYLIGGSNNQVETIDVSSICEFSEYDPTEGTLHSPITVIRNTNSLTVENDYRNDVIDSKNVCSLQYLKTLGFPESNQSVVQIPVTVGVSPVPVYTRVVMEFTVEDLINGYFEVSFNGQDFTELNSNGQHFVPLTVGSDSKLTIRARLGSNPIGNKIKGTIKNIKLYDANFININPPETYTGGPDVKKFYFSQFDTETQLSKLNKDELFSTLDIKSLKIDGVEQILSTTYSNLGLPRKLESASFSINGLVNCSLGDLCEYSPSLSNNTIDRIQYGFDIDVNNSFNEYVYENSSYGLLEAFEINGNQIFGIDRSNISNGNNGTVSNPVFMGIDMTKSFYMETESMILDEDDLSSFNASIGINSNVLSAGPPPIGHYNSLLLNNSPGYSFTTSADVNEDQLYYISVDILNNNGVIQFDVGGSYLTFSGTGSFIETIRATNDSSTYSISTSGTYSLLRDIFFTDRIPTKGIIEWDPSECQMSYTLNGVEQTDLGFLLDDGSGRFSPTCVLDSDCTNSTSEILGESYWDNFKSKLLFLDYDIGSKLYFFDFQTGEYQLPQTVDISDISELNISSITGEKSWADYSRDSLKEFQYQSVKNDSNVVKYNTTFSLSSGTPSYTVTLNGNSTNDISDINGGTYGLLPNFGESLTIGTPSSASFSYYFYGKYLVMKQPVGFEVSLGDIIRIENSLITDNMMVIYTVSIGSENYIYLSTNFNQSMTNRLVNWVKSTTITNLNKFSNQDSLVSNFNLHPIGVGYQLIDNGSSLTVDPQFNPKTAYYNLECVVNITDSLSDSSSQDMLYINKVISFGYEPTYNILDYLSKNSEFNSSYRIGSLPQYDFSNDNSGVLYTVSSGKISFNSSLKSEWESIPKYTFVDLIFGGTTLESVLIIGKSYDSDADRYIIQTYNYYGHVYDQSDLSSSTWTLRVRNTLGEISSDLQKLNNIQRSSSDSYQITDLSNNQFTKFTTLKSELNFKPNTDSYAKALLSCKEIKGHLSGILYTDYKNELAVNIVNLSEERNLTITSLDKFEIDCEDCEYEDYYSFENPSNNNFYNQVSTLGAITYYTDRTPFSTYGFNNQIQLVNATGSTVSDYSINFATQSGTNRTLEFIVADLENATIKVLKDSTVISTIGTQPSKKTKIGFSDNGVNDLIIRVEYTEGNNLININDVRVGNDGCLDNCYLAQFKIPGHGLSVGDGVILDLNQTIFNLGNEYQSDFDIATQSGWVLDIGGYTSSVSVSNGTIGFTTSSTQSTLYYPQVFGLTAGETYRISFDYQYQFISGTPSISPAFGTISTSLNTELISLSTNGITERLEANFIPTSSNIYIGLNIEGVGYLTLNNISLNKLTDIGEYYDGYQVVRNVIDSDNIVIDIDHRGNIEELTATFSTLNKCGQTVIRTSSISNIGTATEYVFDPYLNYAPIDLFELGVDSDIKQSVEIKPNNWVENNDESISIVNLDMTNYRFRLIDDLSLQTINDSYPWILEAEVRNALIGRDSNGIIWYSGIWDCGRWFGGTWYSGDWRDGEWYNGTWNNSDVIDNKISAEVDILNSKTLKSTWYDGNFRDGTWNGGEWRDGNHFGGTWNNGNWLNGTWHLGQWNNGRFLRGSWIDGTWENGIFASQLGQSNWLDGTWNGGEFRSGHWYGGRFDSKNGESIFGNGSTLSRKSIWESGSFINGTFNSGDNNRHDLSVWKTGFWNNGTFNGGTVHQIIWNNGTWNDGVVKDIPVVSFVGQDDGTYFFTLQGDWQFRINDTLWIINNDTYNTIYGTNETPIKYKVDQDFITVNDGEYTKILVSRVPVSLETIISSSGQYVEGYDDNLQPSDDTISGDQITTIVSYFSKCSWYNGQFQNGIFDGDFFRNGIWENGVMKSGNFGY